MASQIPWYLKVHQLEIVPYIANFQQSCRHCHTMLLVSNKPAIRERHGWCCNNGVMTAIPRLREYPEQLQPLLFNNAAFKEKIRWVNNTLSFSRNVMTGGERKFDGPSNVIMCGRSYHILKPMEGEYEGSLKWFLFDAQGHRNHAEQYNIPVEFVSPWKTLIENVNPIVNEIKQQLNETDTQNFEICISQCHSSGEIAALSNPFNMNQPVGRKVVVVRNDGIVAENPEFIDVLSAMYEPLQYPLLFPYHDRYDGWGLKVPVGGRTYTIKEWCRYRMLSEPRFTYMGKLGGEWIVDSYSRIEDQRIAYLRNARVIQTRQMFGNSSGAGTSPDESRFLGSLPSGFIGSNAWVSEHVANALACAKDLGNPSLFITMTTNTRWPEIVSVLDKYPGLTAYDIPIVVCRAFKQRLSALFQWMKLNLGLIDYQIHVIEYQKRGLPHAHILVKLSPEIPFSYLSELISAEVPDRKENPSLYDKVMGFMQHSKNHLSQDSRGRSQRCNKNGFCQYNFPQPIRATNQIDDRGRVQWRRRTEADKWTNPHIPALLELLDCHIMVDYCSTANVIFYLFKYFFKQLETALYNISRTRNTDNADNVNADGQLDAVPNEMTDFTKARWLCSSAAVWRILGYTTTHCAPTVVVVDVHLQNKQLGQMARTNSVASSVSQLLQYLNRPIDSEFDDLTILDFFRQYVVRSATNFNEADLKPRQYLLRVSDINTDRQYKLTKRTKSAVSRLRVYPVKSGELYYMRAILKKFPVRTWEQIKTVDDVQYSTYQAAAVAHGLFAEHEQAFFAMKEGVEESYSPGQLRFLFASIIVCMPCDALALYEDFIDAMDQDHREWFPRDDYRDRCLTEIQSYLIAQGASLSKFDLPEPRENTTESDKERDYFNARKSYLTTKLALCEQQFNEEQLGIYNELAEDAADVSDVDHAFFLDGKAGRGKTFLMDAIVSKLRLSNFIVLVVGSTALSVTSYDRGRTAHSTFSIPVKDGNFEFECTVKEGSAKWQMIESAFAVLWEEMPMANKASVQAVDELLKKIMNNKRVFGGKRFYGVGDFGQVAPIIKGCGASATVEASIRSSYLWKHFKVLQLHAPMRNREDPELSDWVDQIRDGHDEYVSMDLLPTSTNKDSSLRWLFPTPLLTQPYECIKRSYLSPLNKDVDQVNKGILDRMPGNSSKYYSFDSIKEGSNPPPALNGELLQDYLALFTEPGIPNHELELKEGCICTIQRNLSIEKGLVKNAKVVVVKLNKYSIQVAVLRKDGRPVTTEDTFPLSRIVFEFNPGNSNWTVQRMQFPLRLAYATTFNSCQGSTMDRVLVGLEIDVFAHGQLYTALTRVRRRADAMVLLADNNMEKTVRNVVLQELISAI
jgi:PIF1-like helicase/Helitron helicase-like domain at N-terminus